VTGAARMYVSECHHDDQPHPFVERLIGTIRRPRKTDPGCRTAVVLQNGQLLPKRQVLRSKPPLRTRRRKQRSDAFAGIRNSRRSVSGTNSGSSALSRASASACAACRGSSPTSSRTRTLVSSVGTTLPAPDPHPLHGQLLPSSLEYSGQRMQRPCLGSHHRGAVRHNSENHAILVLHAHGPSHIG
jgi:hypothetical protein